MYKDFRNLYRPRGMKPRGRPKGESCASPPLETPIALFRGNPQKINFNWIPRIRAGRFALLSLLCVLLVSCASHIKRDGPPHYYVDERKIPNACPRMEPLAKRGNMRSYVVFGKRYYVMHSSRNYSQTGIASWYGTKFHARHTSSGEPYDMLAMTAAHKSLPLPTYVEVTNLANHRKVIVKVNDRGPFEANRLIDLSYVAAKKLGMLGRGTAHVQVTAINPYRYGRRIIFAKEHSRSPDRRSGNYSSVRRTPPATSSWQVVERRAQPLYLQVGAFKNKSNALRLQKRLIALLKTNVSITPPLTNKPYFRVKIGPLRDAATANKLSVRLKHLGLNASRVYGFGA